MPWIEPGKEPRPATIMPTGEPPPNPLRTWQDDAPAFIGLGAAILLAVVLWQHRSTIRNGVGRAVGHLRTPVRPE